MVGVEYQFMGIKEGYRDGYRVADAIHLVSSKCWYVYDPKLDEELKVFRVTDEDIKRLALKIPNNTDDLGYMLGGLVFFVKHGTIWNADDV